jgi:hypothetical protein
LISGRDKKAAYTEAATARPTDGVVDILPRDASKSSITNNLGEGFEHGPHFYRLTDKIVMRRAGTAGINGEFWLAIFIHWN